jgi:WD40 repeat protein/predicted Ser/Thr protein kinase
LAPVADAVPAPGRTLQYFGDYELLEEIARGGMGVVYRARQVSLKRVVAVKTILAGRLASADEVRRFRAEAAAAASLVHPNIVPIYEVGEQDGQHYFAMEFVDGPNLAQVVRDNPLPADRAARYVQIIAEAIQFAHERGVLHRDLKPSNVLLDPFDLPRVTDFGLAKQLAGDSQLTLTGQVLGAPSFVPPEQAAGRRSAVGPHSDVYALGAILYHLLTGRPPFAADNVEATLAQVLHNEPAPPRSLNPGIPRDLETICLKCLEKEPRRRYRAAKDLAAELGRFLRREPILARPSGSLEKSWRWCQRNRALAGALLAAVLALVAGTIASTWQAHRAQTAEQEQARLRKKAEDTLSLVQVERAEELFEADDQPRALAQLASVLTTDPANRVAASRLLSALSSRNLGLPLTEPLRHEGPVNSASFSPDGLRVVTASNDKTARVWDASTGKPLTGPMPHETNVFSARFSPDGGRIVTACGLSMQEGGSTNGYAQVWDAFAGKPLTSPLRHRGCVPSAQFSPDGHMVVTASSDHTARVWDAGTGNPITDPLEHDLSVSSACFSPDGLRVVTACGFDWADYAAATNGYARVWDARTGKPLTEPLWHEYAVVSAEFSPDGRRVVTASGTNEPEERGYAQIWDSETGEIFTSPLRQNGFVISAHFSPDGLHVLCNCGIRSRAGGYVQVLETLTEEPVRDRPIQCSTEVIHAAFSPNGQAVVTSDLRSATAQIWDIQTGQPLSEPFRHQDWLLSAEFSPDGRRVVTAGGDDTARIWDAQTDRLLGVPVRQEDVDESNSSQPVGGLVLKISEHTVQVLNAQTGKPLGEPLRHDSVVNSARFSSNGRWVVTSCGEAVDHQIRPPPDGYAQVWDAVTCKPLTNRLRHEGWVESARFSPDGRRVVTACGFSKGFNKDNFGRDIAGYARLWDTQTGHALSKPLWHKGQVNSAEFSPDGLQVVTASEDQTARVWDATTGLPISEPLRHAKPVSSARFSNDGRHIITQSDKTEYLWDNLSCPGPVPSWLPQLALLASQRISDFSADETEPAIASEFVALRERILAIPDTDYYTHWAKWFFADHTTRTTSPFSNISVPQYFQDRLQENTLLSLQECVNFSPSNGLAFARLARATMPANPTNATTELDTADLLSRHAVRLAPHDAEVLRIRSEIAGKVESASHSTLQ